MKITALIVILVLVACTTSFAQQKMSHGGMTYIYNPKPNNILYHDTLYRGSRQFGPLFYRTGDMELIHYYEKHQSNKIIGQIVGAIGTITTVVGISLLSSTTVSRGTAWAMAGGGFALTLTGGYLSFTAQRNLQMAVDLFNSKHARGSVGIGVAYQQAGLVYAF